MNSAVGSLAALGLGALLLMLVIFILTGMLIGAIARWLIPGPTPMSWAKTFLYGIGGSFVGGLIGRITGLSPRIPDLVFSVLGAVLLILLLRPKATA